MDSKIYRFFLIVFFFLPSAVVAQEADSQSEANLSQQERDLQNQFEFGYNAYQRGDIHEAVGHFRTALDIDTNHEKTNYWLAKSYYTLGYNDSAVKLWNKGDTYLNYGQWHEREREAHELRYKSDSNPIQEKWNYVGLISGQNYDQSRNLNPSALLEAKEGGWFSTSYKQGKLIQYGSEGRILNVWSQLGNPTDVVYHPDDGLLVTEDRDGRILHVMDTGVSTVVEEGFTSPQKIFRNDRRLYLFNFADQQINQISLTGDTVGNIWSGSTESFVEDVTLVPEEEFWLLDTESNRLIVIDGSGRQIRTISLNRNLQFNNLWWYKGKLLASGRSGLAILDQDDGTPTYLTTTDGKIQGQDISDVILSGDRLLIASYQASQILVYRPPNIPSQDLLIQDRRMQYEDFPVIRMNLILEDPIQTKRFQYLGDENFGMNVEGEEVLPSFLRHSGTVYGKRWIIIVDNQFNNFRKWDELLPFLNQVVKQAPQESQGTLWKVVGKNKIVQPFTEKTVLIENRLNNLDVFERKETTISDTEMNEILNDAMNIAFEGREPTGIVLVSSKLNQNVSRFSRMSKRSINNSVPIITVSPSIQELPFDHPLHNRNNHRARNMNLGDLKTNELWKHYNLVIGNKYTAIFRSRLNFLAKGEWRPFELSFHYFDQTRRHEGGYQFP